MPESKRAASATRALQPGHRIELLKGGEALFAALVASIDTARSEVLLETYIFEFAGAALPVAESLERAAARGVTVRVVVDGFGSSDVPLAWQSRWKAAGVRWRIFSPASGWRLLMPKRWRRLHRKLVVVDGTVAYCGGINLLDDYLDPTHGKLDEPRFDFAVRVTGPLVADVHETMTRLWLRLQVAREARQHDFKRALQSVRDAARAGADMNDPEMTATDFDGARAELGAGMLAGLVLRDNLRFRKRIEHFYRYAVAQAQSEIIIANAYFVPGVALQRALLKAAGAGCA
jgi:cardiolipin synthase